jgi:hypothetical protein
MCLMAIELKENGLACVNGVVEYPQAFFGWYPFLIFVKVKVWHSRFL